MFFSFSSSFHYRVAASITERFFCFSVPYVVVTITMIMIMIFLVTRYYLTTFSSMRVGSVWSEWPDATLPSLSTYGSKLTLSYHTISY